MKSIKEFARKLYNTVAKTGAVIDVPVPKEVKPESLVATGVAMGLVATGIEYGIAWGYERVFKEPIYVYHPDEGLKGLRHTSYWSPVAYGAMSVIGVELGRWYCLHRGYTNLKQVRPDEWLGMFLAFGGGMTLAEMIGGSFIRHWTGKEYYRYPTSGLKYTHAINGVLWGTAGILGFIGAMKMMNRFEKAPMIISLGNTSPLVAKGIREGLVV